MVKTKMANTSKVVQNIQPKILATDKPIRIREWMSGRGNTEGTHGRNGAASNMIQLT